MFHSKREGPARKRTTTWSTAPADEPCGANTPIGLPANADRDDRQTRIRCVPSRVRDPPAWGSRARGCNMGYPYRCGRFSSLRNGLSFMFAEVLELELGLVLLDAHPSL